MDIDTVIKKISKYTHREQKYLLREVSVLKELKEDIENLIELLKQPPSKKFNLILADYRSKVKRGELYAARFELRLNVWVRRIEILIEEEKRSLSPEESRALDELKSHLIISQNKLIRILGRGGELGKIVEENIKELKEKIPQGRLKDLVKEENWKKVLDKIKEALGDGNTPGLRSLIVLFDKLEKYENEIKQEKEIEKSKKAPIISKQKLKVDMHFHPDFPKSYNKALKKSTKIWWAAIAKHNIDVIFVTEHLYKDPARCYKLMIEGRAQLIREFLLEIERLKIKINSSNFIKIERKIREKEDYITKLGNVEVFAGMEVLTIEGAEIIVFTEHEGYNAEKLANELAAYEQGMQKTGISPNEEYRRAFEKFIKNIEGECMTDLYLEKRLLNPKTLLIPEVIDICKQRGFGIYMPHPYVPMTGGVEVIGKKRLFELKLKKQPNKEELALLALFWKQKTGKDDGYQAFQSLMDGKNEKEFIELLGADGLARLVRHKNIGIGTLNMGLYLPNAIFHQLSKVPGIGKVFKNSAESMKKTIYTPQALITQANPAFYAGGADAHAVQSLGAALSVSIDPGNRNRKAIYDAIVHNKDPEINIDITMKNYEIKSHHVIGTIKTGITAGLEVIEEIKIAKEVKKGIPIKIEELIQKTSDPNVSFEELLKIKQEIRQPNVMLIMNDDQKKRYKAALLKRKSS